MKPRQLLSAAILLLVMTISVHAQQPMQAGAAGNPPAPLKRGEDPSERLGLDRVMWNGAGIDDIKSLEGKSVVLFVYGTWCPKCNKWSGELFDQIKMAIRNRPVIVLAINADAKDPTLRYVAQREFAAPNILYGYDPSMPQRLGYTSNLFYYVWIDSKGLVKKQGHMGSQSKVAAPAAAGPDGGQVAADRPVFILAKELHEAKDLGEFQLLRPDLPPEAAAILWPVELGQPLTNVTLARVRRMLKGEQKQKFEKTVNDHFNAQAARIKRLARGGVPERLEAYALAEPFVKNLRALPQAKQVRDIYNKLKKDRRFKKELAAMQLYERTTAKGITPQRRTGILRNLVRRYKDTYYGKKAMAEVK